MNFFATFSFIAFLVASSLAVTVSFNTVYDVGSIPLVSVACNDGTNGLITKGFTDFQSLPRFPHIGGAQAIAEWNSDQCGTCWALTYKGKTINVLAIDHARVGLNIALGAMNELTNGQATQIGRIDANVTQVAASICGV